MDGVGTMISSDFWSGTDVFLTGHTGFKGSWLTVWLDRLGARITGYALAPPTTPSMFDRLGLRDLVAAHHEKDVCDLKALKAAMNAAKPKIVFHLAAQPLVRESYVAPCYTLAVNVMGATHVLEAARHVDSVEAVVIITTDKCYENYGWAFPYRENDRLGGADPYSASKAAAELVVQSYRSSFFANDAAARVATARAGNVIGGGDWANDRLIPDCMRAFEKGEPLVLRAPTAVRPWQHVLDPLSGYLRLAEYLCKDGGDAFAESWNFGPDAGSEADVAGIARAVANAWGPDATIQLGELDATKKESSVLRLDSTKARTQLGWQPVWSFSDSLDATVEWYRRYYEGGDVGALTGTQISAFETAANKLNGER